LLKLLNSVKSVLFHTLFIDLRLNNKLNKRSSHSHIHNSLLICIILPLTVMFLLTSACRQRCSWTTSWCQFKYDCHQLRQLATGHEVIKFWTVNVKGQGRWERYALYW